MAIDSLCSSSWEELMLFLLMRFSYWWDLSSENLKGKLAFKNIWMFSAFLKSPTVKLASLKNRSEQWKPGGKACSDLFEWSRDIRSRTCFQISFKKKWRWFFGLEARYLLKDLFSAFLKSPTAKLAILLSGKGTNKGKKLTNVSFCLYT